MFASGRPGAGFGVGCGSGSGLGQRADWWHSRKCGRIVVVVVVGGVGVGAAVGRLHSVDCCLSRQPWQSRLPNLACGGHSHKWERHRESASGWAWRHCCW